MRLIIEPNYEEVSRWAANYVASRINAANPTALPVDHLLACTKTSSSSIKKAKFHSKML